MDISNMKNMVVLKNLPSNIVDEAIVILKNNQKIKKKEFVESTYNNSKVNNREKENSNDYIVTEAEMLISNYISNLEKPKEINTNTKSLKEKYLKLKRLSILMVAVIVVQIILIILG